MRGREALLIVGGFALLASLVAGEAGAAGPAAGTVKTDPARLARIRAAKSVGCVLAREVPNRFGPAVP